MDDITVTHAIFSMDTDRFVSFAEQWTLRSQINRCITSTYLEGHQCIVRCLLKPYVSSHNRHTQKIDLLTQSSDHKRRSIIRSRIRIDNKPSHCFLL